jgi:hypothetical protein
VRASEAYRRIGRSPAAAAGAAGSRGLVAVALGSCSRRAVADGAWQQVVEAWMRRRRGRGHYHHHRRRSHCQMAQVHSSRPKHVS